MIAVHSPLEIEAEPQGGWRLLLWAGHAFDYTTPFRAVLAEIADAVAQDGPSALQLPAYEEGEDFVEGTLQYRGDTIRLYYEYSLGYLALIADSQDSLKAISRRIQAHVIVA